MRRGQLCVRAWCCRSFRTSAPRTRSASGLDTSLHGEDNGQGRGAAPWVSTGSRLRSPRAPCCARWLRGRHGCLHESCEGVQRLLWARKMATTADTSGPVSAGTPESAAQGRVCAPEPGRGSEVHPLSRAVGVTAPLVRVSCPSHARLRGPSAPLGRGHAPVPRMWQLRQHMSSRFWATLAPHHSSLLWPRAGASGPGTYEFNPILRQPLLGPPFSGRGRHAGGVH